MKTNLFSRFRNLFRRAETEYEYDEYDEYSEEEYSDVAVEEPVAAGEVHAGEAQAATASGRVLRLPHGSGAPSAPPEGRGVHVPLAPIVSGMPLELQSRLLHEVGDLSIFLPVDKILPQLSTGAVSVSFGELRAAAPRVFGGNQEQDESPVDVPLSAILPHISPDMLARKHGPLDMDIPDDIVSPFEGKGKGLAIGSLKQPTPTRAPEPASEPAPAPAPRVSTPPPAPVAPLPGQPAPDASQAPTPVQPRPTPMARPVIPQAPATSLPPPHSRGNGTPQPSAPAKPTPSIAAGPVTPATPSAPSTPLPSMTRKGTQILPQAGFSTPPAPKPAAPAAPKPVAHAAPKAVAPAAPKAAVPAPSLPAPAATIPAPAPAPIKAAPVAPSAPKPTHAPLVIGLSSVADVWPDSLKQEILQLNLAQAKLELPYEVVERGLKRGRLRFPWSQVRSWINPQPQMVASAHDAAELELPLRIVAPLFVAQKKDQPEATTKVAVDKDIPNLFFGLPQPDTAGVAVDHSVNKPLDTNYYVWDDEADSVPDDASNDALRHTPTAGTEFVTRYATPNEVVSRAEGLDGVEGAVIALPDGLMVASKLPPGLNGDTLAAFLPQLFGKVTQCTQELRMGELNNLNFTVGNVPWKIFRVNALYFAAFGAMGRPMPTAKLAALAGELDHKAKV